MSENQSISNRSELEAEISRAMVRFEKECMGRGPTETRTYILGDMILIRLKGVLTQAEQKLASASTPRRTELIKQMRNELLNEQRPILEVLLKDIIKADVVSVHTDLSTKTGERVIVVTFDRRIETESYHGNGLKPK